jgi:transposase
MVLFPTRLDEAVDKTHPVRDFERILKGESFDETFKEIRLSYTEAVEGGRPAYDPFYLTSLAIYCTLVGENSSRKMEAACFNRIDVRWLMCGQTPDHVTICNFLRTHKESFQKIFEGTLRVGARAKVLTMKHVAVDGSKIEASASRDSAKSEAALREEDENLRLKVEEFERERVKADAADERAERDGVKVCAIPENDVEAWKKRQDAITEALAALERRKKTYASANGGKGPCDSVSTTDPDAPLMRDKEDRTKPNYTTQIAVDADSGLIAATVISDNPWDGSVLPAIIDEVKKNTGTKPEEVSADSAYNDGPTLQKMASESITVYMPDSGKSGPNSPERASALAAARSGETLTDEQIDLTVEPRKSQISREAFRFDPERNIYICPQGKVLDRVRTHPDEKVHHTTNRTQYGADPKECAVCPLKTKCLAPNKERRMVTHDEYEPHRVKLRLRMDTPEGRATYRKRTSTERAWAWIKFTLGLRKFKRRRFAGVAVEFSLACIAHNMRILVKRKAV